MIEKRRSLADRLLGLLGVSVAIGALVGTACYEVSVDVPSCLKIGLGEMAGVFVLFGVLSKGPSEEFTPESEDWMEKALSRKRGDSGFSP